MIEVKIDNVSIPIPESWSDVISSGRYLAVISILATVQDKPGYRTIVAERVFRLYADVILMQARVPSSLIIAASMKIVDQVYPVFNFIFDPYDADHNLQLLIDNPLPEIKHGKLIYKGMGSRLEMMTGIEMEECSWAHCEYTKTGDIAMLDRVVAVLYHPEGVPGFTIEEKAKDLHTLPPLVKLGVKFWYESCESWWYHSYMELYEGGGDAAKDSLAASRLVRGIAGVKRGPVAEVRKLPRHEIYFELSECRREYEELKPKK